MKVEAGHLFFIYVWLPGAALIFTYVLIVYFHGLAEERKGNRFIASGDDWLPGGFLVAGFWPLVCGFWIIVIIVGGAGWLLREGGTYAMIGILSGIEWARCFGWRKWLLSFAPEQNWKDKKDWSLDDVYAGREHLKK